MRHRRVLVPLAVVGSIGIALMPALTWAATPAQGANAASSTGRSPLAAAVQKAEGLRSFSSPASRSHYTSYTRRDAAAAVPNPHLALAVTASQQSALTFRFQATASGLASGSARLTIAWGDQTSSTATLTPASASVGVAHTYDAAGGYAVSAEADDGAGDVASNKVDVTTLGAEFTSYGPVRVLDTRSGLGLAAAPVAAGATAKFTVTGTGLPGSTIPSGITAVVLNLTATQERANGYLAVYSDQAVDGSAGYYAGTSNLNYDAGRDVANLVFAPVGPSGVIDVYNNSRGSTQLVADVEGYYSRASTLMYAPVHPARILDTRNGTGNHGTVARIPADGSLTLHVAGSGPIPTAAAVAALNLTVVSGAHNGLITAYPTPRDGSVPAVSNLNYGPHSTIANMATVAVSPTTPRNRTGGDITFHNTGAGPVDLIVDALGYYAKLTPSTGGNTYIAFNEPWRDFDSRINGPVYQYLDPGWRVFPNNTADFPFVAGAYNLTVVGPTGNGYLTMLPYNTSEGATPPTTSTLNYTAGQTVPNCAVVNVGDQLDSSNLYDFGVYLGGSARAELVIDVFGEYLRS